MLLSSTFKIKKTAIQNSGKNPVDILTESRSVVTANSFWDPVETEEPSGSSVQGILQARILEWVTIPFSRGSP